jgi:LPLT family lysophospholipid transporter-like MFS transporter
MMAVLAAQFLSALGDNALLVAAIALVKARGEAGLIPLLQEFFVIPYILLAPFVGPFADSLPKGRAMFLANGCKLAGAGLMFAGANPLAAYGLVGVGAAAYSPAKYGILSQFFGPEKLVKANGMLEGSTIVAILLGVVAGGLLADYSLNVAFLGVTGAYFLAAAFNLLIPRLPPEHPLDHFNPARFLGDFLHALKTLWQNRDIRFTLLGTSVFWGTGSTLRLLLFVWVPVALGIAGNQMPANLMGILSLGIVLGAVLAGALISLGKVNRALIGGLLLGPLVILFAYASSLPIAAVLLVAIGAAGGVFVVPLNALLQERGHESVGAGRALAVQNLWENGSMLLFVSAYSLCVRAEIAVIPTIIGFGVLVLIGIAGLALMRLGEGRQGR